MEALEQNESPITSFIHVAGMPELTFQGRLEVPLFLPSRKTLIPLGKKSFLIL